MHLHSVDLGFIISLFYFFFLSCSSATIHSPFPFFPFLSVLFSPFLTIPPLTDFASTPNHTSFFLHFSATSILLTTYTSTFLFPPHTPNLKYQVMSSSFFTYLSDALKSSALLQAGANRGTVAKALGLYILYIIFKHRDTSIGTRRVTNVPGPRGLPLIGSLLMFLQTPMNQLSQLHDRYHDKYGFTWTYSMLGLGRVVMCNEPAAIEHVLKTNFWAYEKGPYLQKSMEDLLGHGIFGADGHVSAPISHVSRALYSLEPYANILTR